MGCSQNYGPLWVIGYITAPNIEWCQNGTLFSGTTHLSFLAFSQLCAASFLRRSTVAECANTCIQPFHGLFGYWPVKEGILFKNNGVAVKQSTYVTGRAEVVLFRQ